MSSARQALALVLAVAIAVLAWSGDAAAAKHRRKRSQRRFKVRAPAAAVVEDSAATVAVVPPAALTSSSPFGRVALVTDRRAYLDRGGADGLVAGQALAMWRSGRSLGACTLEAVGDHEATCTGRRLRVGDTFRSPHAVGRRAVAAGGAAARARSAPVPNLPPVVDDQTLQARAAVIADATVEKVEFNGRHAFRGHTTAEVSPGFVAWFTQPNEPGGGYAQERIDGVIRGVELGQTGFHFDGAFSAQRWSTPASLERFRAGSPTQFYLWEAEATHRRQEGDGGTTISVGRLWPYHAPGLTVLDGVQVGRQNETRTAEAGFYGGLVPSAASLAPGFDIWAAGLYGALAQLGDRTSTVRLARQELRVGVWRDTRTVTEAQGLAQLWIGSVTAGGGGRVRWSPSSTSGGGGVVVEQANVDLGLRPSLTSSAGLHARYTGATLLPDAPLRAELPMTGATMHAIADANLELSSRLALAASAGAHREGGTGRHQLHAGAEVRFSRLFRETGGLWVGGEVEQGWLQGENLYLQFVGHGSERVQVLARLSANGTRFETPTAIWNLHELGAYANVDGVLTSWLRLRAWTLLRAPILVQGVLPTDASFGAVGGISLAGAI
jgi:hypothetical protein